MRQAVAHLACHRVADHVERPRQERAWDQLWFPPDWLGTRRRRPRRSPAAMAEARRLVDERRAKRREEETAVRLARRKQRRLRFVRLCSALPRSRTIQAKRITHHERGADPDLQPEPGWDAARPRSREDCAGQPRPCPWVSCRYNLYLDVAENGKGIKINFPGREPSDMPATGSCVLDVAERVANGDQLSLEEVGQLMNLGIERVRQLVSIALQAARVKTMWNERLVKIRLRAGQVWEQIGPAKPPKADLK